MTVIGDRQLVAAIIGAEFANEIADDQLPALLHAIQEDALMVAACAKQATRKGVDNPPSLLMWLIRERKHTGLIPIGSIHQPEPIPPPEPRTPEQEEQYQGWKTIWNHMKRDAIFRQLTRESIALHPDPTPEQAAETRIFLLSVLEEINAV